MDKFEDIELAIDELREAKKERYFGDIVVSYRDGDIKYVRKNQVRSIEELQTKKNEKKLLKNK